jgi:hypothetical protein
MIPALVVYQLELWRGKFNKAKRNSVQVTGRTCHEQLAQRLHRQDNA